MPILKNKLLILILFLSLLFTISTKAWVDFKALPIGSNISAPLNSSVVGQSKVGGLILNIGGAPNGLIVSSGTVGIGTIQPKAALEVSSETNGFLPPRMTTVQRDSMDSPQFGMLLVNTDTKKMEIFDGSVWKVVGEKEIVKTRMVFKDGSTRAGDYYCKKSLISENGQQGAWQNINEGKACDSGKVCKNGNCEISFICGTSTVTDVENNVYNTVFINDQCWLKQNMNIGTKLASGGTIPSNNNVIEKWCYDNSDANCTTYGGLYSWDEAMQYSTTEGSQGICPTGWHIPTDFQQYALENYLKDNGQTCNAARTTSWDCSTAGTKLQSGGTSNFTALLSGIRNADGSFGVLGTHANFWSSSQSDSSARFRYLFLNYAPVGRNLASKAYGFSIRCLKD